MSVHAMKAFAANDRVVETSYLDAHSHLLMDQRGEPFDAVLDERKVWNPALSLNELLALHDYTNSFRYIHSCPRVDASFGSVVDGEVHYENDGSLPDQNWCVIAADMASILGSGGASEFAAWIKKHSWSKWETWPALPPTGIVPAAEIVWPALNCVSRPERELWGGIPARINNCLTRRCWSGQSFQPQNLGDQRELAELMSLVAFNAWLEIAAAYAVEQELTSRGLPFRIYHSVRIARKPKRPVDPVTKIFELDVIALLGYQTILISCTRSSGIKENGFEALHRARQIGGAAAQAIVLCGADTSACTQGEADLHDDIGSAHRPLRVWGKACWRDLRAKFNEYLNELRWR